MKNLDKELQELYNEVSSKEKTEIHLNGVYKRIQSKEILIEQLEKDLDTSSEMIQKLENLSIHSLFKRILGNNKQQLERERQDYLLTVLKHKGYKKSLKALYYEKEVLEQQLDKKSVASKRLDGLVKLKLRALRLKDAKTAKDILQIENQIYALKCQKKELKEAIFSGRRVATSLSKLERALANITKWGSGPMEASSGKHLSFTNKKQIKRYRVDILQVNILLEKFEEELEDISTHHELDYQYFINTFAGFLEEMYDGLISDWVIQNKIKNSMNETQSVIDKVQRIIAMLELDFQKTEEFIEVKTDEMRRFAIKS